MDLIKLNQKSYNKIAKHFSDTRYDTWPELEQFKPFIKSGQRVLDWGCGNGRLLLMLKDLGVNYIGTDQSAELIKIAKQKNSELIKAGNVKFYCTKKKDKIFKPQTFDLVFMIASFFHLPDKEARLKLLEKTIKELKPGGRLLMTVWNLESDWAKRKQKDWKVIGKNDFLIPWKNQQGEVEAERYYHHFTKDELTGLLHKAGYEVEKISYFGGTWSDDKGGRNLVAIAIKSEIKKARKQ